MGGQYPSVKLRELIEEDWKDRYKWCLDREVTKHLNMPDQYPPFSKEETRVNDRPAPRRVHHFGF